MCTPVKMLRRTRAWSHPVQAVRGGWRHPHTRLSLDVGCGGVLAFILGRARLPSSRSTPFSKTCAESQTAREAQTFNLYAKRYKNN